MKKPKVLVVGIGCGYGGTETVVSRFVGAMSDRFAFDTFSDVPLKQAEYSEGDNNIVRIPAKRKSPFSYAIQIRRFFKQHAHEYSAIWFNANSFSNITPLKLAAKYGIQKRIVHFHNTEVLGNALNQLLTNIHRQTVNRIATIKIACSKEAGFFAYGVNSDFKIINNAFKLSDFTFNQINRNAVRKELGLSDSAFIIGTTGRLAKQKNQSFLIRLMPKIRQINNKAHLVIAGEGELRNELCNLAHKYHVNKYVHFIGARKDIPRVLSAFDVFAFPSIFEGLGVSLVEAQANGLPCVISEDIPDLAIVSESVHKVSLSSNADWAYLLARLNRDSFHARKERIEKFNIENESKLLSTYLE